MSSKWTLWRNCWSEPIFAIIKSKIETKICIKCNVEQELCKDNFRWRNDSKKFSNECKKCKKERTKEYYSNNKDEIKEQSKEYYSNNKDKRKEYLSNNKDKLKEQKKEYCKNNQKKIKEYRKEYYSNNKDEEKEKVKEYCKNNKEKRKEYKSNNKEKIKKQKKEYNSNNRDKINNRQKQRRKNDPAFKLRCNVSRMVNQSLKCQNGSKNGKSCWEKFPYTEQELKKYIESLFEPWMNWNNQGNYSPKKWNDNDSSTWKWQLDHIIPQSDLLYDSMDHENFKKCWALSNLRPLSAKQNLLDGVNRTRHLSSPNSI